MVDLTDAFVDELARPIFVLRMANAMDNNKYGTEAQRKGARKRATKARQEIRDLAESYVMALEILHARRVKDAT